MEFFNIQHIALSIMGYPISYVELIGTLFGFISVYYAARANVLTWPTGIINELFLFILFFQVQLYADMLLQVYFFITTLYGWYHWSSNKGDVPIEQLSNKGFIIYSISLVSGTLLMGWTITHLPTWLPTYFPLPAAYPYADSFVSVASILATILLARKQMENWLLWILADAISVILYMKKGVYFLSLEYVIFLFIAIAGLVRWRKKLRYA
jgi:nicotinamide mononucleotide transporter